MRIFFFLLLVALAGWDIMQISHAKPDLLVRSKRRWVLSTIEEELKVDYPHKISQMFNDKTVGKEHSFQMRGEGFEKKLFFIDEKTGDVFARGPVDREKQSSYHITFDVWDLQKNVKIDRDLSFDVEITDINDNAPEFINAQKTASVLENTEEGFLPISLQARDIDEPGTGNSLIAFRVSSQQPEEPKIEIHQLDDRQIRLKFKGCFDYQKAKKYKITVEVKDHGEPQRFSTTNVTLNINDTNSHPPVFTERTYETEAWEMEMHTDLLRLKVEDKDTPNTDGWRAKYFFISGNEEGIYKLETDQKTNEGILSIVKEKNYEITSFVNLKIGVENIQPLCVCKDQKLTCDRRALPPSDSVNITVKMIDTNDPPEFEKGTEEVFQNEETDPGKVLFIPKVRDVDSSNFRFVLVDDPADWVSIDEKTGQITSTKKMDRESPFVDKSGVYKITMAAIDNGEPPATSTCTVNIHLKDVNDNIPKLVNNSLIMCGNKENKVMVPVHDPDADPFSGPFSFSLGDDKLKHNWKLDPAYGVQGGLVSLKSLPYGNYSVPLLIQDKQNAVSHETLQVVVCECERGRVCRSKLPLSSRLGNAAIGLIVAGLLLLLFLIFAVACDCGEKNPFKYLENNEGNQTLIHYNQEGGGAACQAEPTLLTSTNGIKVLNGFRQSYSMQSQMAPVMTYDVERFNTGLSMANSDMQSMKMHRERGSHRSFDRQSMYSTWSTKRSQTYKGNSSNFQRSLSMWSSHCDMVERTIHKVDEKIEYDPEYQPCSYDEEGSERGNYLLDKLSLNDLEDDLQFLDVLGPKFKTLAEVCYETVQAKNTQL